MSTTPTPEERAASLVATVCAPSGGAWFVEVREPEGTAFRIGPYENPAHARGDAEKVRKVLTAVIREARATGR
jgi:hypothetical protein